MALFITYTTYDKNGDTDVAAITLGDVRASSALFPIHILCTDMFDVESKKKAVKDELQSLAISLSLPPQREKELPADESYTL